MPCCTQPVVQNDSNELTLLIIFKHHDLPFLYTTQISNAFSPEFYNMKQACHSSTWFWVDITLILLKSPKKLKLIYDISSDFWTMLMDDIFGLLRSQRCKMRLFKAFSNTVSSLNSRKTIHARNQTSFFTEQQNSQNSLTT